MTLSRNAPLIVVVALGAMLVGALVSAPGGGVSRGSAGRGLEAAPDGVFEPWPGDQAGIDAPPELVHPVPAHGEPGPEQPAPEEPDPAEAGPKPEIGMTEVSGGLDPSVVLRAIAHDGGRRDELVRSRDRYEAMFRVGAPTRLRVTTPSELGTSLSGGEFVLLKEGTYRWDLDGFKDRTSFPADLVVQGAGMDKTLLRITQLRATAEVRRLTFRNLTIHCGDRPLLGLPSHEPASISLKGCRVVGFDGDYRRSVMLWGNVVAFHAVDSRFEAGFGRTIARAGKLFLARKALLVRMDGCTIVGPFRSVYDTGPNATYAFADCRFEASGPSDQPPVQWDGVRGGGVLFEGCEWAPGGAPRKRRLSEINPAWR